MSVMYTHAHALIEQAAEESRREAQPHERPAPSEGPTLGELFRRVTAGIFFIPQAGPPVFLLLGPWLLLVLLIIPPAALLITLVLVLAVAAGLLVALAALVASPYLLVRHLREHPVAVRSRFAFIHRLRIGWFQHTPITPGR
jgi:hypothetical protein